MQKVPTTHRKKFTSEILLTFEKVVGAKKKIQKYALKIPKP